MSRYLRGIVDPLKFSSVMWPNVKWANYQKEIIYSVAETPETICVAGNQLGKDFVAGFIALWFFLSRHPCRVVTTSADYSQLESVLWGEIRRFIQKARYPLTHDKAGPLVVNHLHLRKIVKGEICGISYCIGRVAAKGEGMLGHHATPDTPEYVDDGIPRTLWICDEASGVADITYERASTWAKRILVIGNPFESHGNFFEKMVKGDDVPAR